MATAVPFDGIIFFRHVDMYIDNQRSDDNDDIPIYYKFLLREINIFLLKNSKYFVPTEYLHFNIEPSCD